jgi:hypothetical protein
VIPLELWYSHEQTEGDIARTHDELDAALDRIAALSGPDWPAVATVHQAGHRFGPLLYVGFHEEVGALMYPEIDSRAYTVGEGTQDGDPILYMYTTSDSEFPPNAEVPAALIRQAAHEFADTGLRPTCVPWQTWERPDATTDSEWPDLD